MSETHDCPICREKIAHSESFPHRVCERCATRTADAYGRRLRFTNDGSAGGLRAVYLDNGEECHRLLCYIDGRKCFVGEHRFGGIVIEVVRN